MEYMNTGVLESLGVHGVALESMNHSESPESMRKHVHIKKQVLHALESFESSESLGVIGVIGSFESLESRFLESVVSLGNLHSLLI
jgi:hypothetical protein